MTINETFERVVCINPVERVDDWMSMRKQFSSFGVKADRVDAVDPSSTVMPRGVTFNSAQLSELLSFYRIIQKANIDRIAHLFIFWDNTKLSKTFNKQFERLSDEIPKRWDLIFFGHKEFQRKILDKDEENKTLIPAFYAKGSFALGINSSFYHIFLETAKVPTYTLDDHIHSIALALELLVVNPPLVTKA